MADDPTRLSITVEHANGTTSRWGPDEIEAGNIPQDLSFSTAIPGGFTSATGSLLRNLTPRADESLYDTVTIAGAGNRVAWEGRMQRLPRTATQLTPAAVGWAAHLKDDQTFREIYVDHDFSRWGQPALGWTLAEYTAGYSQVGANVEVARDSTTFLPALRMTHASQWTGTVRPLCGVLYDAQGINIAKVGYAFTEQSTVDNTDAFWSWTISVGQHDDMSGTVYSSSNLRAASGSGTFTPTLPNPWAQLRFAYTYATAGAYGALGAVYAIDWTALRVYGSHGLTVQAGGGLLASDIIANIVSRAAPRLSFTTGTDGSIRPTAFSIPQAAFHDPGTAEHAISTINAYHNYEWGCWENREFFYRPTDPARTVWNIRLSEGATLNLEGDDADEVVNGLMVVYTLGDGTRRTAGPTGSGAHVTSALLADTSDNNPATLHGLRNWQTITLTNPTTDNGAVTIGAAALAEKLIADRRGNVTATGMVEQRSGSRYPAWMIRAGDYLTVADRPGEPVRRIVNTTYNHATRTVSCDVGNRVLKVDSILARLDSQAS